MPCISINPANSVEYLSQFSAWYQEKLDTKCRSLYELRQETRNQFVARLGKKEAWPVDSRLSQDQTERKEWNFSRLINDRCGSKISFLLRYAGILWLGRSSRYGSKKLSSLLSSFTYRPDLFFLLLRYFG